MAKFLKQILDPDHTRLCQSDLMGAHCQLALGAKYNSHFFIHQESLFKQPMPGEDRGTHFSCFSLLPLGYIAI